jgi:hypothetical protein
MRLAAVLLTLVASSALAQGAAPAQPQTPEAKAPEASAPQAPAPESKPAGNSTLIVHCTEECNVRVEGKMGLRKDPSTWEFRDVAPGKRRLDATGRFLNRPLYSGYVEVPASMKVTAQIDHQKRLTLTERTPLAEHQTAEAAAGPSSVLTVRCPKACTVTVDGTRRGAVQTQPIVVRSLTPGEHTVEVSFLLGKVARTKLDIPAASEVFATATESGITVTNTRPLADK